MDKPSAEGAAMPTHHYSDDEPLVRNAEFMEWMADLEKIVASFGEQHEGHPYGGPLIKSTGLWCWLPYFDDGYSPKEAFAEDRSYWD